jgi:2-methylisocitrate lyase-like PEP mutase family enzyme
VASNSSVSASAKRASLAALVRAPGLIAAPGVYDMISAKLADRLGFGALYLTGYGVAASHLGIPDAGLASYSDVVERVRVIASGTQTPLICDADTGFGGLLNVRHTVRSFEEAGCAAIQLEDQESPKRCGLTAGCRVIATAEMVRKIEVALEARRDPALLVIARTDAHAELGGDAAIERGVAYAAAGADLVFIQGLASEDDIAGAAAKVGKPLLVNVTGKDGIGSLASSRLEAAGCRVAIYPGLAMLAAAAAISDAYETLRHEGSLAALGTPLYSRDAMHRLMGFEDVWAFEDRWGKRD